MSRVIDPPRNPSRRRVTEVGAPELVDGAEHPVAAAVGILLLVVVLALGAAALGAVIAGEDDAPVVPQVIVPRLQSRPMPEAQAQLERMGLLVDIRFEPNEVVPPDVVVDQEPIAGARLEVGEQVVLVVSDGPMGILVPKLAGSQVPEAQRTLANLGLTLEERSEHHELVPMGHIIRSEPAPGARAELGSKVVVVVSSGPRPREVPDVVGARSYEAFAAIGRADLEIDRVRERYVEGSAVGTVLELDPAPGTEVPRDTPIEVVVGVASPPHTVPEVVGLRTASARRVIDNAGLDAVVRTEAVPAGDRRAGRVIRQSPLPGLPAAQGADVVIVVGEAARNPEPPPSTEAPPGD
ncbi:MAG TPA: PASTA domain-containing protein [Microthrixaceae bacterium]|nr:PASTA domain-containing protein [Microthrixaceae bacterium]